MNSEDLNEKTSTESSTQPAPKAGENKIPVLGMASGLTESVKEAQQAEKALERAMDPNRSEEERSAANRAAAIHGRRALFKAVSAVLAQVPSQGAAAALTLDGANMILDQIEGDLTKIEKNPSRNTGIKRTSTESFMQEMRKQAAATNQQQNGEQPTIRP